MFKGKSGIIAPPHTLCPVGAAADSDFIRSAQEEKSAISQITTNISLYIQKTH